MNVVNLEGITYGPSVAAAFALVPSRRQYLISKSYPLIAEIEEPASVVQSGARYVGIFEGEFHRSYPFSPVVVIGN
jgi:hypothetical protein